MILEFIQKCRFVDPIIMVDCDSETVAHVSRYADVIDVSGENFVDLCMNAGMLWYEGDHFVVPSDIDRSQYAYLSMDSFVHQGWCYRGAGEHGHLYENTSYRNTLIKNTGAWTTLNETDHLFDESLCDAICTIFAAKDVKTCTDLGCGAGIYVSKLLDAGFKTMGFDGNPHTEEFTNGLCKTADLSRPMHIAKQDCIISLEVGEHIPAQYETAFIDNITNNSSKYVIISWAVPGQGGYGHVNCKSNEYIKNEFLRRGFNNLEFSEFILRSSASTDWFKNTIMAFERV